MGIEDVVHPEQLKMFMTPREIVSKYQPLDADRMPLDPRAGAGTSRAETTAGHANIPIDPMTQQKIKLIDRADPTAVPQDLVGATHIRDTHPRESSEQLWARKAAESTLPPEHYRAVAGGTPVNPPDPYELMNRGTAPTFDRDNPTEKQWQNLDQYMDRKYDEHAEAQLDPRNSLATRIANEGVQNPVHLGSQFGSEGKPQIVGGHHRLAAAMMTRPDDLIPVLHHETFEGAREEKPGGYRYT